MMIVVLCEKFCWDYHRYMQQPTWFIQTIIKKMEIDKKKDNSKAKHGRRF